MKRPYKPLKTRPSPQFENNMSDKKVKNIFVQGAISPDKIARSIEAHQSKHGIGGHCIFLGQVRADQIEGKAVTSIEFTAQEEMANQICHDIKERAFERYPIHCMHIYHSLGEVKTGELCFFVFVSAAHRTDLYQALEEIVNDIKANAPIFGKELFDDQTFQWKENKA